MLLVRVRVTLSLSPSLSGEQQVHLLLMSSRDKAREITRDHARSREITRDTARAPLSHGRRRRRTSKQRLQHAPYSRQRRTSVYPNWERYLMQLSTARLYARVASR